MLIGFDTTSNILKNKLVFILRVVKDQVFQTELKLVEKTLTENPCENLPVSFMISKNDYTYGKLEEINAMLNELFRVVSGDPEAYAISQGNINAAEDFLATANYFLEFGSGTPEQAANCHWWANHALISQEEVSPEDADTSQTCRCPYVD
jgi:hypothetical protein